MPVSSKSQIVLGMMSGTSFDGLDLALVKITEMGEKVSFELIEASTLPYSESWKSRLIEMEQTDGETFWRSHKAYGHFLGKQALDFLAQSTRSADLIASHGHTIFHRPDLGYTFQAGCGQEIATLTGLATISDFRSKDVSLGGQGAPLVPIGDRDLFSEYEGCLNIGGFANLSFSDSEKRIAYDIAPANYVLNHFARILSQPYDDQGSIARKGTVNRIMLSALNRLPFYAQNPPKSLGREWVEKEIFPLLESFKLSPQDVLTTFTQHLAHQIALACRGLNQVLITGGGAYNQYLLEVLEAEEPGKWIVPKKEIIEFKEAIVFAYLGWLRLQNRVNCLSEVTGAKHDHSGGLIHHP